MASARQYVISVTAAAIACAVVLSLSPKGAAHGVLKMLCGIFLTFTVLSPISRIDFGELIEDFTLRYDLDGEAAAAFGEELSRDAMADIIKAETEAYILDKAAELNATLEAEVTVSDADTPVPVAVALRGEVSPYAKQRLAAIIEEDLGISKEDQLWTG